jgi:hypothetical protein
MMNRDITDISVALRYHKGFQFLHAAFPRSHDPDARGLGTNVSSCSSRVVGFTINGTAVSQSLGSDLTFLRPCSGTQHKKFRFAILFVCGTWYGNNEQGVQPVVVDKPPTNLD